MPTSCTLQLLHAPLTKAFAALPNFWIHIRRLEKNPANAHNPLLPIYDPPQKKYKANRILHTLYTLLYSVVDVLEAASLRGNCSQRIYGRIASGRMRRHL
jgi:hypothetical protein